MSQTTRRSQKFCYWLVLLFLWQTPTLTLLGLGEMATSTSYAQNLASPTIGEASTKEIATPPISLEQWQALQVASSQALLQDETVLQYFDENFNIDGSYGELKTGALVTDWEALAKTMGTSGLALAGAYAVYRRRRLEYLAQLRSGDANALEALFEENFGANRSNPASPLGNEGELEANPNNTPLPSATPPNNNDVWQDWGKNKGLPASGATLAALYALWIKRKSSVKPSASKFDDFFQSFFSSENPPSYNRFNQSVYQGVYRLTQEAKSAALADFETKNPAPTPPVKSQNIVDYETQAEEEAQYQTDLATYNQRKTEVLNNAAETYKGWSQAIYAWWNHAYQKANEAKQWVANLGQAAAQAHRTLQEEQNAKTESFKLTLQQLTQAYDPNELSALLNENFVESKPQAKLNLKTLKQQLENLKAAKVDNDTWVEYRDNYFHAQGYGGNYRYGYTKYTYMPNRERWEHRNAGRPDDSKAQKEFKYFYDRQIYQTQQQIKLAEAQEFNQNIKILSGESWLSEIEHFDSKTSAEEKFPDIQKSAEHVALEKQVQRLTLEQKTAYEALITQEQQALQYLQSQRTNEKFFQWLNRTNQYNSRGKDQQYYAMVDGWIANTKAAYQKRKKALAQQYLPLAPLQTELKTLETQHQELQAIRQTKVEAHQTLLEQIPQINHLKTFIQTLQNFPQDARVQTAIQTLSDLQTTQANLKATQDELNLKQNSWTKTERLNQTITQLQTELKSKIEQLATFQQSFLSAPTEDKKAPLINTQARALNLSIQLENNDVYQFLKSQATAKKFYQTYGQDISVLETMKATLETKLENLSYLDENYAYYYDHAIYRDYVALKNDYKKLLNNELPDVWVQNWSWYPNNSSTYRRTAVPNRNDSLLHDWYHKSLTIFNTEAKQSYLEQIKERETQLFEQRALAFDAQENQNLQNLFTEKEIRDYQALVLAKDDTQQQVNALNQAQTIATRVAQAAVTKSNLNLIQAPPSYKSLAIQDLKKNDVTSIALSYASKTNQSTTSRELTQIPPQYLEALWQAYRRYNEPFQFNDFRGEVERLIAQEKTNYSRNLLADSGIPSAPVQTKTVRDYLEDPTRFNKDVDAQIADVKAGIPLLHEKFAGQNYLITALKQADAKIAALERYKKSGPEEVAAYQQSLALWKYDNAEKLAQVESGANNHFASITQFIQGFWDKSDEVVAQKAAEIEAQNIIDTRDTVELIKQTPGGFSTEDESVKEELAAFLANLSNGYDEVASNTSFELSNEAANDQAEIYNTYESKFLRSQGLTWDKYSNERIENLHPAIRAKTIEFINKVQDELGIDLRINIDGNFRSFDDQLKLYCNDKDSGICEGVAKWDDTGKWKSNAKPGESYHNYGLAVDFTEINKNGSISNNTDWEKVALIGSGIGFDQPLPVNDAGHFEIDFGYSLSKLKEKTENNETKDGYVEVFKELGIELEEEDKIEAFNYHFDDKGLTQEEAQNFIGFSEDYFQVWVQYQNHAETENSLRAKYVNEAMQQEPQFRLEDYQLYWKNLSGISVSAKAEVLKVYQSIVQFSKQGQSGEINSALNYIETLRDYEETGVMNYKMASHFALDAYEESPDIALWGFQKIANTQELFSIDPSELNNSDTGFKASIYEDEKTLVVAFSGTDNLNDWVNNFQQGLGWRSKQYEATYKIAEKLKKINDKKIIFTGHSLGGGLASVAAAHTGSQAITFNSAGVHPYTLIQQGINFSAAEYISSFGGLSAPAVKKLLSNKTKDTLAIAREAGYFNIPAEAMSLFSKDFSNITNHVTRGDILTDKQEDIPLLPIALGEKVSHGSILDKVSDLDIWYSNPFSFGASTVIGIEQHRTFGN